MAHLNSVIFVELLDCEWPAEKKHHLCYLKYSLYLCLVVHMEEDRQFVVGSD